MATYKAYDVHGNELGVGSYEDLSQRFSDQVRRYVYQGKADMPSRRRVVWGLLPRDDSTTDQPPVQP